MIIAIDVHYRELAKTVAISFKDWESEEVMNIKQSFSNYSSEYISGEFYKRELPCIEGILNEFNKTEIELIIIDGYVTLNEEGKFGLGAYLFEKLNSQIPIIGVAKKKFSEASNNQIKIYRGISKNPLFITSIGIDLKKSAYLIKNMKGKYRIPDLLKLVDQKSKEK
ncbi:Endonuclease V [Tenacibaculum sp. 190524A05c]|uniref:endonuclease V n=1 Tax=Tenacibaculum platacis TaxID=3137852 RepID=UPI0031FB9102